MEVASLFRTPQPHLHLAELRIEGAGADQSPVAFSDPCAVGRKRRCLFPAFSPRKRMLLELPPFSSSSAAAPSSAAKSGGSGAAFAFLAASPRQPLKPVGSSASGGGFLAPEPPTSIGINGGGGFAFLASPTPVRRILNDGGGFALLRSPQQDRAAGFGPAGSPSPASAAAKKTVPAGSGVTGDGGFVAPYTISGLQTPAASPVKNPPGSSLWSRRLAHAAAAEGRTIPQPPCDKQLHITLPPPPPPPPHKVPKTTVAPATGEPSRGGGAATLSTSTTATPCCTFLTSPVGKAKASNQEREARASRVAGDRGRRGLRRRGDGSERELLVRCPGGVLPRPP